MAAKYPTASATGFSLKTRPWCRILLQPQTLNSKPKFRSFSELIVSNFGGVGSQGCSVYSFRVYGRFGGSSGFRLRLHLRRAFDFFCTIEDLGKWSQEGLCEVRSFPTHKFIGLCEFQSYSQTIPGPGG